MLKVGITGKIASGKSEVENILLNYGFKVFDLDKISHELFENNQKVKEMLLGEFQTLDRKIIGQIVFSDDEKKKKLEEIIHPELKKYVLNIFEKEQNEKVIFVSGALLFKSGFDKLFDKIIFIDAKEETRLSRLMKRNNLSKDEALKRLNLQDDGKMADFIIENDSNLDDLNKKIIAVLKKMNI